MIHPLPEQLCHQRSLPQEDLFRMGDKYDPITTRHPNYALGSKFQENSGRNSGSEPFSRIFGSGVAGIIFLGIAFFRTF
jgi:hypothetical protein